MPRNASQARKLAAIVGPVTIAGMVPLVRARVAAIANLKTLSQGGK